MKQISVKKLALVKTPANDVFYSANGITGLQQVEFKINFYGHEEVFTLDTKITNEGQFVIDGNGFIPQGYKVQ